MKCLASRQHLIDRLNDNPDKKLILITAPAGYGKSTLVSGWANRQQVSVAWLSIEQAIEHYLKAKDHESAATLIERVALTMINHNQWTPERSQNGLHRDIERLLVTYPDLLDLGEYVDNLDAALAVISEIAARYSEHTQHSDNVIYLNRWSNGLSLIRRVELPASS